MKTLGSGNKILSDSNWGLQIAPRTVSKPEEFDDTFAASASDHPRAMLAQASPLTNENRPRIVALTAEYRLPPVYERREFVEEGGLLSYGQMWRENSERAAVLVDKILKGAKPADLPVEQPTRCELVINLKTANELGLTIPPAILGRADEVIT